MFNEKDIEGVQKTFFRALINTYQFFVLYANIDGFTGSEDLIPLEERPEIDQWIIAELHALVKSFRQNMDSFDVTPAARSITDFTVNQLSNWYVRRNRRRFWKGTMSPDKLSAYQTLHSCLITVSQLMSPIAPFLSEDLYQRLTLDNGSAAEESVHLKLLPEAGPINVDLMKKMHDAQRVVYLTRSLREQTRQKTRQPLARILVATTGELVVEHIEAMRDVILEETNIKDIEFIANDSELLKKRAKANFKALGPRYGKMVKPIAAHVSKISIDEINQLERVGSITFSIEDQEIILDLKDIEIQHEDIEGWTIGADDDIVVALDTTLTDELVDEGIAREFVSKIQTMRKEGGLEVTDRIVITFMSESGRLKQAINRRESYICAETLAVKIVQAEFPDGEGIVVSVNDLSCRIVVASADFV